VFSSNKLADKACEAVQARLRTWGVERCAVEGKGFGVIAKKSFKPGDTLLCSPPLGLLLREEQSLCHRCLVPATSLKRCGGCKWVHYCSRECQKEDWDAGHKTFCKLLQNFKGGSPLYDQDGLMLAQVVLCLEKYDGGAISGASQENTELCAAFLMLPSHKSDYPDNTISGFVRTVGSLYDALARGTNTLSFL